MEDSLTEKLQTLLSDPASLAKLSAIAGRFAGESPAPEPVPPPPRLPERNDPRLELLRALRPLVAPEKREKLDDLVRIATVASLLSAVKQTGREG